MSDKSRIYRVREGDAAIRLVDATSSMQVIRHCAIPRFEVSIAKPKEIATLVAAGVKVEVATPDAGEPT